MNLDTIQALLQATVLLPEPGRRSFGTLLCGLAFVNAWSTSWRSQAAKLQGYAPAKWAIAMAIAGQLNMTEQTLFDALLPPDTASILTPEAAETFANTLSATLYRLRAANPALAEVLQPWQFQKLQGVYDEAYAAPNTLGKIITAMGRVKFEHAAPSLACVQELNTVMTITCQNTRLNSRTTAPLIAQLVNPRPNDVVVDWVCGPGHLLLGCAAHLAQTYPGAALRLHGKAKDRDQWVLAKMQFLLGGQAHHAIHHANALDGRFAAFSDAERKLASGGANIVVMALPQRSSFWGHAPAFAEQDPRFKVRPPTDSRLALAWLGLAAMKPNGGRMALLMPTNAFCALGSLELRQHMVEMNWLDAVITLPGIKGYVLLMLHTQRTQSHIGFIQTKSPMTAYTDDGTLAVLDAWQHYQAGTEHPCVMSISREEVAGNAYEFDVKRYAASATLHHAKAMKESE